MKTTSLKRLSAVFLASVLTGMMPPALRAQPVHWPFQEFNGNICGLNSSPDVTLTYDPTQDDTGNGGGSCHISTDYSQGGLFQVTANNVDCCMCLVEALLPLTNYNSVDFDVKWDNSSTVPLSYFNTNFGSGTEGIVIGIGPNDYDIGPGICYSNVIIPDAATNGWVHVSMAIDQLAAPNASFTGLHFTKMFPACGPSTAAASTAAFWLDNLQLLGPTNIPVLSPSCRGSNFTIYFSVIQNATYTVLKSTNFVNWTSLVTNYPPGGATTNMTLSYTDTNAGGSQAYYRIRSP